MACVRVPLGDLLLDSTMIYYRYIVFPPTKASTAYAQYHSNVYYHHCLDRLHGIDS